MAKPMKAISDCELVKMDLKVLKTLLTEAGCSGVEIEEMKQRRRRLHNRQSAKLSATRRKGEVNSIAQDNVKLKETVAELQGRNTLLEQQLAKSNQMAFEARLIADRALHENQALRVHLATLQPHLPTNGFTSGGQQSVAAASTEYPASKSIAL